MKHVYYFVAAILVSTAAFCGVMAGLKLMNLSIGVPSFLALCIGFIMLYHWSALAHRWRCEKCGSTFNITLWQSISGTKGGPFIRELYCPYCRERHWCRGEQKDTPAPDGDGENGGA